MTVKSSWSGLKSLSVINRRRWMAIGAVVLAAASAMVSQTTTRANRITQEVTSGAIVTVKGTVNPKIQVATDLGAVSSDIQMDSMTLNIGLSTAQQTELETLLAAQQNPNSPLYHKWLTQEEYGARFGLTDSDVSKVTSWLSGQGFTVKSVAPSRNLITFSGKAWQAESAFHTQLHRYALEGKTHIANTTDIRVPAALGSVITRVGGLNSFRPKAHAIKAANPNFTSHLSGSHFLTPGDWATIYDVSTIYNAGYTGTGMHLGVVGQTYFPTSDVDKFRAAAGLPATNLTMKCISSADCTDSAGESVGDMGEADLDVEWSGGIAKDATIDFIYASASDSQSVYDALYYAIAKYTVNGAVVPVLTMSYGNCETDLVSDASLKTAMDNYLAEAASAGQTVLNSSGDAGAAGCDVSSSAAVTTSTKGAVADWPASSPYVLAVGGTTFNGDGTVADPDTYADAYWSGSTSADIISSALSYIPETSWNDTTYDGSLSSSGGGVSEFYSLPSWQTLAPSNFTGTAMRFVPDVAFSASADHDPYLVCTQVFPDGATLASQTEGTNCVSGFRYTDNTLTAYGGTSASSPSFAGLLTLLVQKYGNLGTFNKTLYSLASNSTTYASVFHDITTGDNKQPCTTGTGCTGGYVGYSALTGYDLVTGLGSVDAGALYTAMGSTLTATSTTVSASPTSVTIGDTVTLTATVNQSAATGTITFKVGSTSLGTATISSGTATLPTTASVANGFSAGTDTITATYGGDDTTYASSSGTTTLTVAGITTSTSVSASTTTLTIGGSETLTATVTPATATGTVTFKVGSTSLGSAAVSSGTATLSVIASTANGFSAGTDTITATYGGSTTYDSSYGTTTITAAAAPTYTLTASSTTASISAGSSSTVTLTLVSTNYAGTVTLAAVASSTEVTASTPVSVTLTNGGTGTSTLTIATSSSAANHAPALPWKSGGVVVFAVLLGAPFTLRRKRAMAVMLTVLTISLAGFMVACSSGGSSTKAARTYTVTITPTGSGTVTNPSAVVVTVTVP